MKLPRRRFLHVAVSAAAIPAASGVAKAEVYPSRTITMIVPLPPGVETDALARILAEHMRGTLGQSIIVENITGAGGTTGTAHVARAARCVAGAPPARTSTDRSNISTEARFSRRFSALSRRYARRPPASPSKSVGCASSTLYRPAGWASIPGVPASTPTTWLPTLLLVSDVQRYRLSSASEVCAMSALPPKADIDDARE
jgi:hypothetical protein